MRPVIPLADSLGFAVLCGVDDVVEQVIHVGVATEPAIEEGTRLADVVVDGDRSKYGLFHQSLMETPCALDWLVTVNTMPEPDVMRMAGCKVREQLLIVAADAREDATAILETFAAVNNELLTQVRMLTKAQVQTGAPTPHSSLYEDMSRLNNELANLQRELAKKNRELEAARATLADDVEDRTAELARTVEDLARAMRAKDQFFAQMSHELRTPLNSVIGFSGVLLQGMAGELNEEQTRQVEMISKAGNRLLSLVNDILDLSKASTESIDLQPTSFDIRDLIEELAADVAPLVEEKSLDLECSTREGTPELNTDREILYRILLNLLSNAVKFTEAGSISLRARPDDGSLSISVVDAGPGIPLEEQDMIFKPFVQGKHGDPNRIVGSGLGLAISRELATQIGGRLVLARSDDSGSEFTLRIPIRIPSSD